MTNTSTRLLSVPEFADGLGITAACVCRWLFNGRWPTSRSVASLEFPRAREDVPLVVEG